MKFIRNEEVFSTTFCLEDAAHQDAVAKAVNQLSKELGIHIVECSDNYLTIGFNGNSRYGLSKEQQENLFKVAEEIYNNKYIETNNQSEEFAAIAMLLAYRKCDNIDCIKLEYPTINVGKIAYKDGSVTIEQNVFNKLLRDTQASVNEPYVFFFDIDREPISNFDCIHYTDYNRAECFGLSVGYMSLKDYQKAMFWMPNGGDEYGNALEDYCNQEFIDTFHNNYKFIKEHYLIRVLMPNEGNSNKKFIV